MRTATKMAIVLLASLIFFFICVARVNSYENERGMPNTGDLRVDIMFRGVRGSIPSQQTNGGYEHIHTLLNSADPSRCTDTHVLKGENAKEPDVHICLDAIPTNGCVVYSIGIANNWIVDVFMVEQGCDVFSFDPSMAGVKKHKRHAKHLFEPIGIGTIDGIHTGESTLYGKKQNYPVETLGHIMSRHGHAHLTMVRMDVEGAEWDVLEQWMAKGWIEPVSYTHLTLPTKA